jgi:nucleoside-diphosphate-sugar epimerase
MKITIIGGSGFIGTELTRQLLEAGQDVRIVDKADSAIYSPRRVAADVRDVNSLRAALKGTDLLYNLAAEHKDNVTPRTLYHEVNVDGARNVCRLAEELHIDRMVFTSSVAVYGFALPDTDEAGILNPYNDYGCSKAESETIYRTWVNAGRGRSLTIVRPTVVFGPRNRGNVYNLIRQMSSGRFIMIGSGTNIKSMAFVENVASFLRYVSDRPPGDYLFNYVDKPDLSMNELVHLVRKSLGKAERMPFRIPERVGYIGGKLFDGVGSLLGREFSISGIRVKKFCATTQFRSSRIDQLGFKSPVPLRDALERTIYYEFLSGQDHDTTLQPTFQSE